MAQEAGTTVQQSIVREHRPTWWSGVVAGLVGGLVMGILFSVLMPPVIEVAIPALMGLSGGLAGWVVHMSISAVFGVGFVALVTRTQASEYDDSVGGMLILGVLYGTVLWLVAAAVLMPLWLGAVGFPNGPPLPNLDTMGLVTHLVYGAVLGVVARYV